MATAIYTHSLPPIFAVVWTGVFNFVAVLVTSGAVAFGILSLLPVELILQVGSGAGFAMVFVLQIAAIPCAGVSVAHGPADGQKGIGSIMHFLVGNVPTASALNRKCLRILPMHASLQGFS